MAKKGQKFKKYTVQEKIVVVKEYLEGNESIDTIAKKYGITSGNTVFNWIRKFRNDGDIGNIKRGRPSNRDDIDYKTRYDILKKYLAFLSLQQKRK